MDVRPYGGRLTKVERERRRVLNVLKVKKGKFKVIFDYDYEKFNKFENCFSKNIKRKDGI